MDRNNLNELFNESLISDGKVIWNTETVLKSNNLDFGQGHWYTMLMPLRNTIMVRMKNNSPLSKIKIEFHINEISKTFRKRFEIEPFSDYKIYYFNLSDVNGAEGYLKNFSFFPKTKVPGNIEIEFISFEREKKIYDYVGKIDSCKADNENVTVRGRLKAKYSEKNVEIYETGMSNWSRSISNMKKLCDAKTAGQNFTATFPLRNGNMTRLSSHFYAVCNGKFVSDWFTVENYEKFSSNPYKFSNASKKTYNVIDFGAVGDGYTNDTKAIQDAINTASSLDGGKVVVPGDKSPYGRRFVITSVKMRNNVELHIEENAILWQSKKPSDYSYEVAFGHDVSIPGVEWTHAGLCHNFPFIWGRDIDHFKITGKGALRFDDAGSECEDGINGGTIWRGCGNKIHLIALSFQNCKDFELRDFSILRSNCYHLQMFQCENVYIANVTLNEVTCASGDGFTNGFGTHNVKINRCFALTNDDVVVMSSSYDEPRGLVWWNSTPDKNNSVRNIEVCHSDFFGGHGICFITWGTNNPDLSRQQIYNVNVYDNVLNGDRWCVGSWCDNPYYGKVPFDNSETNDFSPVHDVRIVNNRYDNRTTVSPLQITSIITDSDIKAANEFQYGDFERPLGKDGWISGLSNWSIDG